MNLTSNPKITLWGPLKPKPHKNRSKSKVHIEDKKRFWTLLQPKNNPLGPPNPKKTPKLGQSYESELNGA